VSAIYLASTLSIPFAGVLVDRAGRRISIVLVRARAPTLACVSAPNALQRHAQKTRAHRHTRCAG
jgi:hypothetical protein